MSVSAVCETCGWWKPCSSIEDAIKQRSAHYDWVHGVRPAPRGDLEADR